MADDDLLATLDALIGANQDRRGALLPLLHAIQAQFGYIPDAAVPRLAQAEVLRQAQIAELPAAWNSMKEPERRADFARLVGEVDDEALREVLERCLQYGVLRGLATQAD